LEILFKKINSRVRADKHADQEPIVAVR